MSIQIEISFNGRMIELDVDRNSTIYNIKNMIYECESVSIEQQKLLFNNGNILENDRNLAYYNITDRDCLVLQRQATWRQFWISFVYFGSFIGLGLFMGSPGPILKDLQYQTNSDLGSISFVFSSRAIGYIIGSIIFGLISDKYASYYNKYGKFSSPCWPFRPHYLFGICLILLSFCMSILIYIHNLSALTIIISITGICSGGIDCFGNVLLLSLFDTDNEKDQLVDPYMQLLHFAFAIGAFASPLIIQFSFEFFNNSYKIAFWLMSVEAIIFGIIILFISTPLRKQEQEIREIVDAIDAIDDNTSIIDHDVSDAKYITYGSFDQSNNDTLSGGSNNTININENDRKLLYRIFVVLSCAVFLGIYVGSEVAYGAYITIYSIDHLKSSYSSGRYMSSVYWGGLSFGRLSAVYISKKLKPVSMLIFDLLGCFVASSILFIFNTSMNAAWIASILYGFFMASIFPSIFLIAEQTVKVDGKYASIMIFGASCGEFIIPTTEGNLMNYFGEKHFSSITIILVIILFCVMLILLLGIYINDIYRKITGFFSI